MCGAPKVSKLSLLAFKNSLQISAVLVLPAFMMTCSSFCTMPQVKQFISHLSSEECITRLNSFYLPTLAPWWAQEVNAVFSCCQGVIDILLKLFMSKWKQNLKNCLYIISPGFIVVRILRLFYLLSLLEMKLSISKERLRQIKLMTCNTITL